MAAYQLTSGGLAVIREADGAAIPTDPRNRDYQAYLAWIAAGNTPDAATAMGPQQSAAALLAPKLAAGIALTSTGTPALNATYALDAVSTDQIFQIGLYAAQFSAFPSGSGTQPYPDITGVPHTFNVTEFVAFLRAVAPLVSSLTTQAAIGGNGGTPSWPSQSATIA